MAIKVKAVERKFKFTKDENDPGVYRYAFARGEKNSQRHTLLCREEARGLVAVIINIPLSAAKVGKKGQTALTNYKNRLTI